MSLDRSLLARLVGHLATAVQRRALYPAGHPRAAEARRTLVTHLEEILEELGEPEVTILRIDRELAVGDRPLRRGTLHASSLARAMAQAGVERLTLRRGLDDEECSHLAAALCGAAPARSTAQVSFGRIRLPQVPGRGEAGEGADPAPLVARDVIEAAEAFAAMGEGAGDALRLLDELIWQVIETMSRRAEPLRLAAEIRQAHGELFRHSLQVALLVILQGRSLGVAGPPLRELGLAALLHDVGKLSLPRSLLTPRRRLSEREWRTARRHPELGAARLCALEGAGPLPVLVAFEHHLRWDRKPAYPPLGRPRRPSLGARLTAIADTWDHVLRRAGSAGEDPTRLARRALQGRAGTHLDPELVERFLRTTPPTAPG